MNGAAQVCTGLTSNKVPTVRLRARVAETDQSRDLRFGGTFTHPSGLFGELAGGRVSYSGNGLREYVGPRFISKEEWGWSWQCWAKGRTSMISRSSASSATCLLDVRSG